MIRATVAGVVTLPAAVVNIPRAITIPIPGIRRRQIRGTHRRRIITRRQEMAPHRPPPTDDLTAIMPTPLPATGIC